MKNEKLISEIYNVIEWIDNVADDRHEQHIQDMLKALAEAISILQDQESIDLFEFPELLPREVINILSDFSRTDTCSYEDCAKLISDLNEVGYTCEYGLDASPYNLTKL